MEMIINKKNTKSINTLNNLLVKKIMKYNKYIFLEDNLVFENL